MKERKFWKFWGIVAIAFAVCGLVLGLRYYDVFFVAPKVNDLAAQYRAAGLPWEGKELERELQDSDNGVSAFREAMNLVGGRFSKVADPGIKPQDAYSSHRSVLDPALDEYVRMSRFKGLDFHRDWDRGLYVEFFEYSDIKSGCRYLGVRATEPGHTRDLAKRLADLRAALF